MVGLARCGREARGLHDAARFVGEAEVRGIARKTDLEGRPVGCTGREVAAVVLNKPASRIGAVLKKRG
jgi:hypothetical protein